MVIGSEEEEIHEPRELYYKKLKSQKIYNALNLYMNLIFVPLAQMSKN